MTGSIGFVRHCHLQPRPGDAPLFSLLETGHVIARLDGYAVVPMEEWRDMRAKALDESVRHALTQVLAPGSTHRCFTWAETAGLGWRARMTWFFARWRAML